MDRSSAASRAQLVGDHPRSRTRCEPAPDRHSQGNDVVAFDITYHLTINANREVAVEFVHAIPDSRS
jgi:hypothetical protein